MRANGLFCFFLFPFFLLVNLFSIYIYTRLRKFIGLLLSIDILLEYDYRKKGCISRVEINYLNFAGKFF